MYRCESCGALFIEPFAFDRKENLDGENGWEIQHINLCPWCGGEWFAEESGDAE